MVATPPHHRPPRPGPTPGLRTRLPIPILLLIVLAAFALGWTLPVLGISLLAFLLLDTLITTTHRRRTHTKPPVSNTNQA